MERQTANLCVDCGKNQPAPEGTRCENCRLKANEYRARKRKKYIEDGKCNNCGASPVSISCKELCNACQEIALLRARELAKEDKQLVMQHYGNSICGCCGEKSLDFLTIDHINGEGANHRRELFKSRDKCGQKFYRWLIKNDFPPGYQVLCFNCNYGKHINGTCPHRSAIKPSDYQQKYGHLKHTVMFAYGGVCSCCGENNITMLNIDHVEGRKDKLRGIKLYRWLIKNKFPSGFQVLCLNCNVSKHLSGTCNHLQFAIISA